MKLAIIEFVSHLIQYLKEDVGNKLETRFTELK